MMTRKRMAEVMYAMDISPEDVTGLTEARANARKVDENVGVVKHKAKKEAKE